MKNALCIVVTVVHFSLAGGFAYSQEREAELVPRGPQVRPTMPMPVGPMGGMMGPGRRGMMLGLMRENPKLAGMMMQMRGEMMRIRGEEMSKMGEVMKRYGERLEKELSK